MAPLVVARLLLLDTSYITIPRIAVGDFVYGSGVTSGTTVAAINVGGDVKDITLSAAMSISDGVTLTFVTPSNTVVVDDLTDIVVGMSINEASGTNFHLTGTPRVSFIDTVTLKNNALQRQVALCRWNHFLFIF